MCTRLFMFVDYPLVCEESLVLRYNVRPTWKNLKPRLMRFL